MLKNNLWRQQKNAYLDKVLMESPRAAGCLVQRHPVQRANGTARAEAEEIIKYFLRRLSPCWEGDRGGEIVNREGGSRE